MRLVDRGSEKQALDGVLDSVRRGMSGALVLRGESGMGKSALLDHAAAQAGDMQVVRTVAVESEQRLGFAAIHQLLLPFLPATYHLPEPQRRALGVAFGLESGPPADLFLVGLAVLTLLSDAAEARPVLCVIDDAHWLDGESAHLLSFVARRLLADRVGLLFAELATPDSEPRLEALPSLPVSALPEDASRELLGALVDRPIDPAAAARIVAETGGNPLAIVEAAHELTPDQLAGRVPLPELLPVGLRLERSFLRRVQALPAETWSLLLLAAAAAPGQGLQLRRAAAGLGIPESAAVPAEAAGLVTFSPQVRFAHPLARSAVYHGASVAERRLAHLALAAACDPETDAVARAWHLAATVGGSDESVAAQLEGAADQARSRGGSAGTAALLERSAQLTPDDEQRSERGLAAAEANLLAGDVDRAEDLLARAAPGLRSPSSAAEAARLHGKILAARGRMAEAVAALVDAAARLRTLDAHAARGALLSALEAAAFAGWTSSAPLLDEAARIAQDLPATPDPPGSAPVLLLEAYRLRLTSGYAAAVPAMRAGVEAFLADDLEPDVAVGRLELAAIAAADLLDDVAVERLITRWIDRARGSGALGRLGNGLGFRAALVDAPSGRLAAARTADEEARRLGEATHNRAVVPPTGAHMVVVHALAGNGPEARAAAAATSREAPSRGAGGESAFAAYGLGLLEIGLGNYEAAVGCLEPAYLDDTPLIGTQSLPDLVEAAVRSGRRDLADQALQRLAERATASGTSLALGLLARSEALLAEPDEAQERYEEAIPLLALTRAVPQLGRAHLLYGEWLRRQRRRREAREELRAALDLFEATGLDAFAGRTRIELNATGERITSREDPNPEELTPQEAQIAALVSRGDGNREIAAQLFVSPSTVEYHLRKVFRKVGVTSRTQLARHMMSQGAGTPGPAVPSHAVARPVGADAVHP